MYDNFLNLFYFSDSSEKKHIIDLIQSVQTFFEASAELQFEDSDESCRKRTPDWIRFEEAMNNTFEIVSEISKHCLNINDKNDNTENGSILSKMLEKGFEINQIFALVQDLIIAAADTTSYSTLWSIHLLALHDDVQEKAQKEAIDFSKKDKFLANNYRYLRWCNKESMRLFPVAPFLTRILDKPIELTEEWNENILKKDQLILISTYSMARSSDHFDNPDTFCPERWKTQRNSFASLPFGHGARKCIGMNIAENQMIYFLVKLLENFRLKSENVNAVDYTMKLIGMPESPIKLSICKRYQ